MKKVLCVIATLAMLMIFPLAGCGDETADVEAAADGFMSALEAGDLQGMKEYSDPSAFEEGGAFSEYSSVENMGEVLAESLELEASDLGEKTNEALQNYVDTMMQEMVTSYEIKDVTIEDGVGKARVSTTFGFNPEKASNVMQDTSVQAEVENMTNEYVNAHRSELAEIYTNNGQTALMQRVLDDLAADILDYAHDQIMATGETTQDTVLLLEKNDEGKWLVTGEQL